MKITLTTIKMFIKKNKENLYIRNKQSFDSMIDGSARCNDQSFRPVKKDDEFAEQEKAHTLGVRGAWFVLGSRDYFTVYEDSLYTGYEISNCCDIFILAIKKEVNHA